MKTLVEVEGTAGKGWKCGLIPSDDVSLDSQQGSLGTWLFHCPHQAAFWEWYIAGAVHLRPIQGSSREAHLRFPTASHEIFIFAIDPAVGPLTPENFLDKCSDYHETHKNGPYLTPSNYVHQWGGISDKEAVQLLDAMAVAIVKGMLPAEPPLSGGDYWTPTLDRTLEHIKTGGHALPPRPDLEGFGRGKTRLPLDS